MSDDLATTRWTLVLSTGSKSSVRSDQSLNELCQTYSG
ncbi:MAG: hypothetical protein RIS76_2873 [Verrucomicrobiota bacterium]|jgi:hypothetical protein